MARTTALKLINFMVSLRRLPPLSELSGDEERILFELYQLWEVNGALSVSDAYSLGGGKSASTAYRHMVSLKEKGLLEVAVDNADKRKRSVTFTKLAEQLFAAMA